MATLKLADTLKKRKLSKRKFAKMIGVRYSAVFRYFNEGYDPPLSRLEIWAKALNCRIRDLFDDVK